MRRQHAKLQTVEALAGYASDERGRGVAYARLAGAGEEHLLRVSFRVRRGVATAREAGYAALTALAAELRERGFRHTEFGINDSELVADLEAHRDVPAALVLPYVRLRCSLNQFASASLRYDADAADLDQRARAEVALHVAA